MQRILLKSRFAYAVLILFGSMLLSVTPRSESVRLFVLSSLLVVMVVVIAPKIRSFSEFLVFFLSVRIPFLLTKPLLSDDYFRFHWDALLSSHGMSPYSFLPVNILGEEWALRDVFFQLNSPEYYSVYPSTMQMFFSVSMLVTEAIPFVFSLKFFVFALELSFLKYLYETIGKIGGYEKYFVLVSLLPIVYMEGLGNLHFEVVMMNLFLFSYCLYQSKSRLGKTKSIVVYSLSVFTKLTVAPLGLLFGRSVKQYLFTGSVFLAVSALMFVPYVDGESSNAFESLALYFNSFEFNASFYYLFRAIGFELVGYNTVVLYGLVFKAMLVMVLFYLLVQRLLKNRSDRWLFHGLNAFYLIYCFANPTLHPWYLIVPLYLTVFTKSRVWVYWSVCIVLSYGFYQNYEQIGWWLYAEYALLVVMLVADKAFRYYKLNRASTKGGILSKYF